MLENLDANHWLTCFVSCGEYDPSQKQGAGHLTGASASGHKRNAAGMASALDDVLSAGRVPKEVVQAVVWACGLKESEKHIAERVARCMPDVEQEAMAKWMLEQQPLAATALAVARPTLPSRRRLDLHLRLKRAWGAVLGNWCREQKVSLYGRLPWGTMASFGKEQGGEKLGVTDRMLLRYARAWQSNSLSVVPSGAAHGRPAQVRRRRSGAGRPHKAVGLREVLFEWFCMVRGAIKTRLPLAALAAQARLLRQQYMASALKRQEKVQVPQITSRWLQGWRRQYNVSLRTPNRRWTVSRPVCLERCRITWQNLYSVIKLCELDHGYSPVLE